MEKKSCQLSALYVRHTNQNMGADQNMYELAEMLSQTDARTKPMHASLPLTKPPVPCQPNDQHFSKVRDPNHSSKQHITRYNSTSCVSAPKLRYPATLSNM